MTWISVKDRLPKMPTWVLTYHDPGTPYSNGYILDCYDSDGWYEGTLWEYDVTHWMELPAAPEVELAIDDSRRLK
jgi:hypothetical protein